MVDQLTLITIEKPLFSNQTTCNLKTKKTKRINTGISTNKLIFSAYQASNSDIFPLILELYSFEDAKIADVTFGKGVFWKKIDRSKYETYFSDLKTNVPKYCKGGVDCRHLPFSNNFLDCVVFDPPYMHTPGGTAHNGHQNYEEYYANNISSLSGQKVLNNNIPKYHEAVLSLYYESGLEAARVLKQHGIYVVKCQDEVCSNQQRLTHIEVSNKLFEYGFIALDLFVVMRKNSPGVSRLKNRQYHARKNHSYFMVYKKL